MSSKVYSVDVLICATAYIRADSPKEAARRANENFSEYADASTLKGAMLGEVPVSGAPYSSTALPDVSLSPAMTFQGPGGTTRTRFVAADMSEAE